MPGSCGELVAAGACGVRGTWTEVSSRGGSSSMGMLLSVRFWPVHSAILKILVLSHAGPSAVNSCQQHTVAGSCSAFLGSRNFRMNRCAADALEKRERKIAWG